MKILWIVNTVIPQIADICKLPVSNGGGWISAFYNGIVSSAENNLTVCFPYVGGSISFTDGRVKALSFLEKSLTKYDPALETFFYKTILSEKPDVIHIFGTEFPHSLAAVKACKRCDALKKCVVSIQGIISACAKAYYAGLPKSAIFGFTLRDFLKVDNVYFQKKKFEKRGEYELETLKIVKNVIGRTDWDYSCVKQINADIKYHFCNESLRAEFYSGEKWNYDCCEKHSIFITQSYYPLKGLHNLIGVFSQIAKAYPDMHIYTTGNGGNFGDFYSNLRHQTYYQQYLHKLIRKYSIQDRISFLGNLNAGQIRDRLLKSNVFILPSSLENSPNSLGEAMMLGVPCVCSDVGGVSSLMENGSEGFQYPFDKPYVAGEFIKKIFIDISVAKSISKNAIKHAERTHSIEINENTLRDIYLSLCGS